MEFSRKTGVKRRSLQRRLAGDTTLLNLSRDFPLPIQMYNTAPDDDISLEEFKKIAVLRRNFLKEIEYINTKYQKWSKDWNGRMREISRNHRLDVDTSDELYNQEARRRDYISHFILRLSYSQSENLRRWMVSLESDLFRYRFENTSPQNKTRFMSTNPEFNSYVPISKSEYDEVKVEILNSYIKFLRDQINREHIDFYKIPFTLVPKLVASRSLYMKGGNVYIPSWELQTLVSNKFRAKLSRALAVTSKKLDYVRSDERINEFIKTLDQFYSGPQYKGSSGVSDTVQIDDIEDLCSRSFPLCMSNLHQSLRKDHHLKHGGRMQYGLFLKGIGIPLEGSLKFWREEFTKIMDFDKFDKQYTYNIRHHYGQEGKRLSYSAFSCSKIINSNPPGAQDNHGCPYRHFDQNNLRKILTAEKIQDKAITEIMGLSRTKQYNFACLKYFDAKHGVEMQNSFVMDHPNKYFFESRAILTTGSNSKPGVISNKVSNPSTVVSDKIPDTSEIILDKIPHASEVVSKEVSNVISEKGAEKSVDAPEIVQITEEFSGLNPADFEDMDPYDS